jgi:glycosyltransferase involved in cell wall biosynthesis
MTKKIKVVSVSHLFYPHVGGVETVAYNVCRFLQKEKNIEVEAVFCENGNGMSSKESYPFATKIIKPFFIFNGLFPLVGIGFTIALWRALSSSNEVVAIVHGRHFTTSLIAASILRLRNINYIYVDSGFQPDIFRSAFANRFLAIIDRLIFRRVVSAASEKIVISDYTENIITNNLGDISDLKQINNAFAEDKIGGYNTKNKSKIALYASRWSEIKDPRTVLQAYKIVAPRHPEWQFLLIGAGDFHISQQQAAGNDNISIKNELLRQADLFALLAQSAIYINSSISEGMSLAVLEAAALGNIPVLSSAVSNRQVASKLGTEEYLFTVKSAADLAAKLEKAIVAHEQEKNIHHEVKTKAYAHFSSSKIYRQYAQLVRQLA